MFSPLRHQLSRRGRLPPARSVWRPSPVLPRRPASTRAGDAHDEPAAVDARVSAAQAAAAAMTMTQTLRGEAARRVASLFASAPSVDVNGVATYFVDEPAGVAELTDLLTAVPAAEPLYVDLEGINLGRFGTVSLLMLYVEGLHEAFIVDVFRLGATAFTVRGAAGRSLGDVLEADHVTKVFFDARNDSNALFEHYGVRLQGVEDLQITDNLKTARGRSRPYVHLSNLNNCVERTLRESPSKDAWAATKVAGQLLYQAHAGGSFEVFNVRPLSSAMAAYCVGDVVILAMLRQYHSLGLLSPQDREKVQAATAARIAETQRADYQPAGWLKALSPWWEEDIEWLKLEDYKWPRRHRKLRLHGLTGQHTATDDALMNQQTKVA